ncbi:MULTISPECIES: MFS transporter [unclassified Streptomyces]|uniref:MFS transporter n=1 Tax=unclassified Streptomyces TaxID=2593676 RepID=UPI00224FA3DB|nr:MULTISPECIES: MFS transporter [unclassified Streptomyces]WSP54944.1 MFS transporter [Streptomyces sp. NBC_01241]WSU24315.1 MFS transporter [Streptomyces sp. NBC_01108]MCX4786612.1 MFS transporter [Streptomyces sp. NBC_01221]MCX4797615.1 MFS transporter [Streptomyces sp. NBC_01242]WSJ38914.1 MFS transporter [Streptomyces sp. NBC_01321]
MPELSPRRRQLVLAICCMSLLIVSLDNTVLNVALPSMQKELHATVAGMQWTIDAYTLVLASLLMLAGSTADRIGRRKIFKIGLVLFTLGSVLCSLAPNLESLVAFRMVQAVGGSMLNPVAMSIITNTFTEPRERARAIGVWGGVVGISMAAGPVIGGLLVDSVGWRSIFWINLPVGLLALLLTWRYVPESRAPEPRRPDPVGQLLVIALLGSLTYAIIEAPSEGWDSPRILLFAALAGCSLIGLLLYEPRRAEPLIDLRFFRSAPFSGATVIAVCAFAALSGFLFLNTLYLQNVRGLSALHAGLYMLPMAALTFVCAPLSGRLVGSRGPRLPLLVAGVAMTACGLMFAALDAETNDVLLFTGYVLFGLGFGMVNAPITNTAVSGMPRSQAGVAAAVASTSRQVGGTLGVAVIGAVLAAGVAGTGSPRGAAYAAAFVDASKPAWWILSGCGLSVLLVGALTSGRWARKTAHRTAERLEAPTGAAAGDQASASSRV